MGERKMKIHIGGKCSDCCWATVTDKDGNILHEEDGYVPDWFFGGGDYIDLIIDNDTGKILNWVPIKKEDLKKDEDE